MRVQGGDTRRVEGMQSACEAVIHGASKGCRARARQGHTARRRDTVRVQGRDTRRVEGMQSACEAGQLSKELRCWLEARDDGAERAGPEGRVLGGSLQGPKGPCSLLLAPPPCCLLSVPSFLFPPFHSFLSALSIPF